MSPAIPHMVLDDRGRTTDDREKLGAFRGGHCPPVQLSAAIFPNDETAGNARSKRSIDHFTHHSLLITHDHHSYGLSCSE